MDKKVVVYSTNTCPYCTRAKQYLSDNNIAYESIDVSGNQDKANEMMQKSGQMGVPVLDIGGEIVVGFDKDKINQALGLS